MNDLDLMLDRRARFRRPWAWKPRYMTELMKEELCMASGPIYPVSNNGTQYTGLVDMSKFNRVMFHCFTAAVGGGGNCVFQLQQTNNSNGVGNFNLAVTNSGTGTVATIVGASQSATLECRADQLSCRYVQCTAAVNTNASTDGCFPWAEEARQHPQGGVNDDTSMNTTAGVNNRFYA